MKKFHKTGDLLLGNLELDTIHLQSSNGKLEDDDILMDESHIDDIVCEIGEQGDSDGDYEDEDEDYLPIPEQSRLLMPSSIGYKQCSEAGLTSLMDQEIQLREGQANDALEDLRMSLAHSCLLSRSRHRALNSQRTDTRVWAEILTTKGAISRHVTRYRRAHQALLNLNADKKQFQCITQEDLRIPADVVEENRIGQRSDSLAWFWRTGGVGEKENGQDWMIECEGCLCLHFFADRL